MKLRMKFYIAVNIGVIIFGAFLILLGIIIGGELSRPGLEAIGIGLLAAGAINIFDRAISLEPPPPPQEQVQRIEVIAEKRIATPQFVHDLKYTTSKMDVIGVSLTYILEELINDPGQRIIDRLLKDNLQMRLFFVHPASSYLEQRAREDKMAYSELVKRQKHAVELSKLFYEQLRTAYDTADKAGTLNTHKTGNLQIKLLDFCPYMTIYRLGEEEIYWGLYTSSTSGVNLPLFRTTLKNDPSLHKQLHQHIHGLLERDVKYPSLVNMSEMLKPELNIELVKEIFGP